MQERNAWGVLLSALVLGVAGCGAASDGDDGDGGSGAMLADVAVRCQAWCAAVANQCPPGPADCDFDCRCRGVRYPECQGAFAAYM